MNESTECASDNGRPNIFNTQSHIWILANASASRVTINHSINNTSQRSISLDNLSNVVNHWLGQFPMPNGDSALSIANVYVDGFLIHTKDPDYHIKISELFFGSFK
jgi:hypothetical protein